MRGRIVLVPFPYDDFSEVKVRPAVCLTNPVGEHRHIVVAFVTSRIPSEPLDTDIVLHISDDDVAQTGLRATSTLRLHRMATVSMRLIERELGQLSTRLQNDVNVRLKRLFELDIEEQNT